MMKRYLVGAMFVSAIAFAATGLHEEFLRREGLRLDQDQGNAINFVRALQYPVEKILEIEVIDPIEGAFLIRDREAITCLGNISLQMLHCKTPIGLTSLDVQSSPEAIAGVLANSSSSALFQEVARRERIQMDANLTAALNFFGVMNFPANRVVALDFVGAPEDGIFALRDRDDIVCLGKIRDRILRCKNPIGLTTVNFQGDSD
jgi:hypothetical protein